MLENSIGWRGISGIGCFMTEGLSVPSSGGVATAPTSRLFERISGSPIVYDCTVHFVLGSRAQQLT